MTDQEFMEECRGHEADLAALSAFQKTPGGGIVLRAVIRRAVDGAMKKMLADPRLPMMWAQANKE